MCYFPRSSGPMARPRVFVGRGFRRGGERIFLPPETLPALVFVYNLRPFSLMRASGLGFLDLDVGP